uniref:Polydeoxyribonucleotide synthase [ATP] n=1 Tax=viral metagenome TaxID=1070528 RepID=A0A6C0E4I8_9ZZZZ
MSTFKVIKKYPILYKKDKSGKVRLWSISAIFNNIDNTYWINIEYGQKDGKITYNEKEVREGKNIGKKNETSIEQQTILICDKTFKDKKEKEEYTENIDDDKTDKSFAPMLADKWEPNSKTKRKVDITFPCFIQPKLDGIRCLTYLKDGKIVNQSRQLKYFNNLTHINSELENILKKNPDLVLDGELYNHDIVFNQIAGIVKKEKLKDEDFEKLKQIQYHIYDCFFENKNLSFNERNKFLQSLKDNMKYVKIVSTDTCKSKDDVIVFHSKFLLDKYEGAILRNSDSLYEFRRSKHLQKFKTFSDDEFEIIDFKEGTGHDLGTVIWKCKTKDGKEFDVRPIGSVQERSELFKNGKQCIGKMLTVTYQELSEFGVPRFPVGKTIRDYE